MAYGDGTFREWRKDGYQFRKFYSSKTDGYKKHRLVVYGKTKKECREKMKLKEEECEKHLKELMREEKKNAFLSDNMLSWLKDKKSGRIKATAFDRLEGIIQNQIEPYAIGKTEVSIVTAEDISEHLHYLQYECPRIGQKKGYSYSTVKKVYELFDQFFKDYYADNLNGNPMNKVEHPQPTKNVGELNVDELEYDSEMPDIVLSDEEIKKFKEQVYLPVNSGVEGRSKYGVAFYFMMMTCLRFGEATALTWRDIDFEKREMVINKTASRVKNRDDVDKKTKRIITTPKNSRSRIVMLSSEAVEALETIRERSEYTKPTDLVLCTKNGTIVLHNEFWLRLKGTLRAAGLMNEAREKKFTPHYLRHSGISYYIRHDIPLAMVSKMAGHSSVAITERVYYHIIHDQQKKMLEMMDGI